MVFYSTSIYLLAWQDLTVHASVHILLYGCADYGLVSSNQTNQILTSLIKFKSNPKARFDLFDLLRTLYIACPIGIRIAFDMACIIVRGRWIWLSTIDDAFRTGALQVTNQAFQCRPALAVWLSGVLRK